MIISQLKPLLGLPVAAKGSMLEQFSRAIDALPALTPQVAAIGLVTIVAAALTAHYLPSAPAPLLAIATASGCGALFGWHDREVGSLVLSLPPLAGFVWTPADALQVLPNAFGLAVVSAVNLLITSRVVEHFHGSHHPHGKRSDADRELGAYGIANLFAGLFGAPFSVGIPARSLANVRCGGSTRLSNILHAAFVLLFMTLLAGVASHIPIAALAGVTAWMGLCLLDWSVWQRLPRMRRSDAAAFVVTFATVLIANAAVAVALGWSVYALRWLLHLHTKEEPNPAGTLSAS